MSIERSAGPWPGATYNGFSGGRSVEPPPPPAAEPPRRPSRGALIGGVAAAVVGGVLFGVFARPELGARPGAAKPATPAVSTATVPVEVAPVTLPPTPMATDRLEVLPPETAQAAARFTPPPPPPLPSARDAASEPEPEGLRELQAAREIEPPAAARAAPPVVDPPPARLAEATRPQPVRPSFRCPGAGSPAEDMVCTDPRLARLDQRLRRAFQHALASGVPYDDLREDQDDWLRIREDAARYSPDAVANIYRQRIAELDDIAGPD